jgi:hypothetical protein
VQSQPPLQQQPSFAPAQPIGSVDAWFANLLVKDKGVLYEDQYLQVCWRGAGGEVMGVGVDGQVCLRTYVCMGACVR